MMIRFMTFLLTALAGISSTQAFTNPAVIPLQRVASGTLVLRATDDSQPEYTTPSKYTNRGVSVDQDGKSNVWAIEPKVEVESKSSAESTQSLLIAGGGLVAAAVTATVILSNLPDPNQF